jgi:hypothetical protein
MWFNIEGFEIECFDGVPSLPFTGYLTKNGGGGGGGWFGSAVT